MEQNHWLLERSKLFAKYSESFPHNTDKVKLQLDYPDCGWIDMHFMVNGEEQIMIPASDVYEPFEDIRGWLENIAFNIFDISKEPLTKRPKDPVKVNMSKISAAILSQKKSLRRTV